METTNNFGGGKIGNNIKVLRPNHELDLQGKFVNRIVRNNVKASEMAANMSVGSEAASSTIDSMANGAKYLDGIWKGDTKETFMEELTELQALIKENTEDLKNLSKTIEEDNKITEVQLQTSYKKADNLYNEQQG